MAISDVLLEGELTFKTYLDKGVGELKSEDFRSTSFIDSPLSVIDIIAKAVAL